MTLYETLQKATSEEDAKASYIKAQGLKNVHCYLFGERQGICTIGEGGDYGVRPMVAKN